MLSTLQCLIEIVERSEEKYAQLAPRLLPALLNTFTHPCSREAQREHVLYLFYLILRTFSWADGVDNSFVNHCLQQTYNLWMSLLVSLIQSFPKVHFHIKKNALRVRI